MSPARRDPSSSLWDIPFVDLRWQHRQLARELRTAIDEVIGSATFVLGPAVERFERSFAAYCDSRYGIACGSGTAAIHLALRAAGVGPGDEVITVSHSFVGTVWGILYCGAKPVFVDIDPHSMLLDTDLIEAAITRRSRAIVAVHLYGHPVDMDMIMDIARRHDLVVIEDAAQAHGARYRGRRVGSIGDFGCFSFYPGKNLGAMGEAGAVLTDDRSRAARLRQLRDHGQSRRYHHESIGYNYRMDGIQGAVLSVKLDCLDRWNAMRRQVAAIYRSRLRHLPDIVLPHEAANAEPVYHLYVIRHPQRDLLQKALAGAGVATGLHYPRPLHRQLALSGCGPYPKLSHTDDAARDCLSLPIYPGLTEDAVNHICDVVAEALDARGLSRQDIA